MGKGILQRPFGCILFIIIISLVSYSNTFHVPFHFDDIGVIVENPIIENLDYFIHPSKARIFGHTFGYHTFKTRYVGYLTFALNYNIHGLNPGGYHIVNLLVHTGNALLVYLLIILAFKTPYLHESKISHYSGFISFFTALLFACHPIQIEAVTYIWQRVASLSALLYLLSLTAYIRWRLATYRLPASPPHFYARLKRVSFYFVSILSAVCAMNTKQVAFTLPVTIALFEFLFFSGGWRKRIVPLLPFFLTTAIIPLNLIGMDKPLWSVVGDVGEATRYLTEISRSDYLFTQFRVILTYLRLILLPAGQNLDYDYPVYNSFFHPAVFLSFLVLLLLFGFGVYLFLRFRHSVPHTRLLSLGIFWFFITLSVESSVIPLIHVINEYRMYLPSIGIFLVITTSFFLLVEKLGERGIHMERPVIITLATACVVLTLATHGRNSIWNDEVSLWQDVVNKSPKKARGHNNLCYAYNNRGLHEKAIEHCQTAIQLDPDYVISYNNLGIAYELNGQTRDAVQQYHIATELYPAFSKAYFNLGNIYMSQGRTREAIEQYQNAVKTNQYYFKAHMNLGKAYMTQDRYDKAREHWRYASGMKPDSAEAHFFLGFACGKSALYEEAIQEFKETLRINPGHLDAYINLGVAYGKSKRYGEAIEAFGKALKRAPDNAEIHFNLSSAYRNQGLIEKAREHAVIARRLNPALFDKRFTHQEVSEKAVP